MNKHLKLKEIIWEVTGKCNNGCAYCGSKQHWKDEIDDEVIVAIATAIAKYPPEQIDVSGGDPFLINSSVHKKITDIFHEAKIIPKILVNPKSLQDSDVVRINEIISCYNWVGVSVNTNEELELITKSKHWDNLKDKTTIISNFNVENIFTFDKIKKFVVKNGLAWQIQYTVYSDLADSKLALYNNDDARIHFFEKITQALQENVKVILADTLNNGTCGAGLCSIGILYNGDVVPCLSMRSWKTDMETTRIEGNVLKTPLSEIWEIGFLQQRFHDFKCCKDYCNNKLYVDTSAPAPIHWTELPPWNDKDVHVTYYAVQIEPKDRVFVYGVSPQITMYAVINPNDRTIVYGVWSSYSTTTNTINVPEDDIKK